MKKNILLTVGLVSLLASISIYFYMKNIEDKKKLIPTQPHSIAAFRESLESKKINLEEACANPSIVSIAVIDFSKPDLKEKFTYLCEDREMSKKLEENFSTSTDYNYFLSCAKIHAENMQQVTKDLKEHYPEDYKLLNFSKENQESVLLKYLKHPNSAYLMAQCESKAEALYWKSVINSGKVEDLKFCMKITEDCISGKSKPEECPANFQSYHDECNKKLGGMKH